MELVLCLCLLLGTSLRVGLGAESFIDEPPSHVVAIQGDTILFRCGVGQHITATLAWQDIDTGIFLTKGDVVDPENNFQKSTRARISIIGDRVNGEYHLEISDLVGEDAGRYACYYFDTSSNSDEYSKIASLSVMTPPAEGYPTCKTDPEFGRIRVGDNVTLVCESRGGNPPAALTWIRERDIINVQYTPGNARPVNRVSIVLGEQDQDKRFVCLARNPATKQPQSCSVKPLRSAVSIRVHPATLRSNPGDPAVFNCISEVIPGLVYTWYVNDQRVDGSNKRYAAKRGGRRLKINPVLPSDDFTLVTCIVELPGASFDLSGSATALFWVNLEDNPDFVWTTTSAPATTTKVYNRLPDFIYNNIDVTQKPPTTEEILTTTPFAGTTKPVGIHQGSNGIHGLVDTDGITIDVNDLLETLIDPELNEPVIPEREPTLLPPETTTEEIIDTTSLTTPPVSELTTSESRDVNALDNDITTGSTQTEKASQNSTDNEISNKIPERVTPPRENGIDLRPQNDIPISSEQKSSNGVAIGLSLGLIFLTLIVLIIGFVLWRNRSTKQKEEDKENQKKPVKKETK